MLNKQSKNLNFLKFGILWTKSDFLRVLECKTNKNSYLYRKLKLAHFEQLQKKNNYKKWEIF